MGEGQEKTAGTPGLKLKFRAARGDETAARYLLRSFGFGKGSRVRILDSGRSGPFGFGWRYWACISEREAAVLAISPLCNCSVESASLAAIRGIRFREKLGLAPAIASIVLIASYFAMMLFLVASGVSSSAEFAMDPILPLGPYWWICVAVGAPVPVVLVAVFRAFHLARKPGLVLKGIDGSGLWIYFSPRRTREALECASIIRGSEQLEEAGKP